MKYIYNPVTGTLDDVETPNLGEKYFASAETDEIIKTIDDKFGPGTVFPASDAPTPPKTIERDMFDNAFRDNAANGGMMRQNYENGAEVMTLNPLFPTRDIDSDDFRPIDVGGAVIPPLTIGAGAKRLSDILFSKNEDESKEEIVNRLEKIEEDKKDPDQEPPKDPFDPEKLLEILESTTYNVAQERVKKKAFNYLKNKIEERSFEIGQNEKLKEHDRRAIINKEFKELLGKNIFVNSSNKKGELSYTLKDRGKTVETSKNLTSIINKRNDLKFKKEKPFRDKGFVPTKEFTQYLINQGVNLSNTSNAAMMSIIKNYGIDTAGKFGEGNFFVKLPNEETVDILKKKNISLEDKVEVTRNLIKENDLKSFNQIKQALNMEGYGILTNKEMNKYFPEIRAQHFTDKDFKFTKTPQAVLQKIRNDLIKNYGSPEMERLLKSVKRAEGYGEAVLLMHTSPKEKKSKDLYNFADLSFGTAEQNIEYNQGLDSMRNNLTNALKVIKSDYEGKDINQKIKVPFNLREKFDFPKEMTIKKYVDRLNFMLTDLSYLSKGKVRGELLNIYGNKMKFIENPAIDYSNIVGKGFLEGQLKKYEGLFKKFKLEYNKNTGKSTGQLAIGEDGYPILKEGKKLTQNQAETLVTIIENLSTQLLPASQDETISIDTVKDIFKQIPKADGGVIPDQEIMNYATGGRVNFDEGSPKPQLEGNDFLNELEFKFNNIDNVTLDDTPITFDDSKSSAAQVADLANPKNIPYYADMAVRAGLRVGEFGARILPATGQLISDVLQKPMFKVKSSYAREDDNEILDYGETPENNNVKFVGGPIFKNFLKNITPTSTEKLVGLDTIINEEKKKMIERGSSSLPVKVAETAALGGELIAPIFPGLKLLRAYAKSKKLPVNDDTKQLLEQDVDMVLESNGMDRRQFLQITGTGGAVILAKMLGFGDEFATATKVAEKATAEAVSTYPPPYFFKLVEKINSMGDDITKKAATQDRQVVKSYKDYEMTEDVATGEIVIRKRNEGSFYDQDGIISDEYIVYKPGRADETTKTTPPDEYDEYTVRPDSEGKLKDSEDGLDSIEEILEEVGDPNSLTLKRW